MTRFVLQWFLSSSANEFFLEARLLFILGHRSSLLGLVLLSERLDDVEDDDDVDGDDGEDGGPDGGDRRLKLIVLQQLLGAKEDSEGQEKHEQAVEEQTQQSFS